MKKSLAFLICFLVAGSLLGQSVSQAAFDLWHGSKYSMFIHFGLYSELGGVWNNNPVTRGYSEQIQSQAGIFGDYYAAVANRFNPTAFDADAIVALAKEAGMQSIVFTSKHHDGFCMFRTKTTDYNAYDATPAHRDFVQELSQACARGGIRFGLYFSLIDWHYPHAYPISSSNADPITPQHHAFSMQQVTELLTQYGPISELWFDMGSLTPDQSDDLYRLVHRLQPDCMVSGRLGNDRYDFCVMGDNSYPDGTLRTAWQTPASIFNETWGYRSWQERGAVDDKVAEKLRSLLGVVSHGGNYLLNIGPKGDGSVVDFERDVLLKIGKWLDVNGEAVYNTESFDWPQANAWGYVTRKGNALYVMPANTQEALSLEIPVPGCKLASVRILGSDQTVKATVSGGVCRVQVPQGFSQEAIQTICLTFDKPVPSPTPDALKAVKGQSLTLTAANAVPDYSYSCFDYYTNYKSVVGYNWFFTGQRAQNLTFTYTDQYCGQALQVTVDGVAYTVNLDATSPQPLPTAEVVWEPTYYVQGGGTSFSQPIRARVFDTSTPFAMGPRDGQGRPWTETTPRGVIAPVQSGTFYIVRNVTAAQACDMVVQVGAGNGIEVLVNGTSLMKHLNPYGCDFRAENVRVHLNQGRNQILVGAYNKFEKQVSYVLQPADNQTLYQVSLPLAKALSAGQTHTVHVAPLKPANPHSDIELANIEITLN